MKTLLQVLAAISMGLSICEIFNERTDGAILFIVWSFYLKYLSDKRE